MNKYAEPQVDQEVIVIDFPGSKYIDKYGDDIIYGKVIGVDPLPGYEGGTFLEVMLYYPSEYPGQKDFVLEIVKWSMACFALRFPEEWDH